MPRAYSSGRKFDDIIEDFSEIHNPSRCAIKSRRLISIFSDERREFPNQRFISRIPMILGRRKLVHDFGPHRSRRRFPASASKNLGYKRYCAIPFEITWLSLASLVILLHTHTLSLTVAAGAKQSDSRKRVPCSCNYDAERSLFVSQSPTVYRESSLDELTAMTVKTSHRRVMMGIDRVVTTQHGAITHHACTYR